MSVFDLLIFSVFLKNTSPGGTFAVGFIPQNFTGHNWFMNNTGPGLRVFEYMYISEGNLKYIYVCGGGGGVTVLQKCTMMIIKLCIPPTFPPILYNSQFTECWITDSSEWKSFFHW